MDRRPRRQPRPPSGWNAPPPPHDDARNPPAWQDQNPQGGQGPDPSAWQASPGWDPQRPAAGSARRETRPGSVPAAAYFVAAGAIVLVAIIIAAGLMVLLHDEPKTSTPEVNGGVPAGGPLPSAYSAASSASVFAPIAKRTADRSPLTPGEVFDKKTISDTDAKASLKLTASKLDARCAAAVWGDPLIRLLQRAGCTQTARGVYADKHFTAMVTIFNVADSTAADQLVAAADPKTGSGFPQPLSAATAFGQGFSTARGVAMGHYVVITWVRRADGTGDETDAGLLSLLVTIGPPPAIVSRVAGHGQNG